MATRSFLRNVAGRPPMLVSYALAHVLAKARHLRPGLTQDDVAAALDISRYSVNQLLNNRRSITPSMAVRLGEVFPGFAAEFWMDLQRDLDLYAARAQFHAVRGKGLHPLGRGRGSRR